MAHICPKILGSRIIYAQRVCIQYTASGFQLLWQSFEDSNSTMWVRACVSNCQHASHQIVDIVVIEAKTEIRKTRIKSEKRRFRFHHGWPDPGLSDDDDDDGDEDANDANENDKKDKLTTGC